MLRAVFCFLITLWAVLSEWDLSALARATHITSCCFLAKILGHGLCSADLAHAARLSKQTTTTKNVRHSAELVKILALPFHNSMPQTGHSEQSSQSNCSCARNVFFFPMQQGIMSQQNMHVKLEFVLGFPTESNWGVKTPQQAAAF